MTVRYRVEAKGQSRSFVAGNLIIIIINIFRNFFYTFMINGD